MKWVEIAGDGDTKHLLRAADIRRVVERSGGGCVIHTSRTAFVTTSTYTHVISQLLDISKPSLGGSHAR